MLAVAQATDGMYGMVQYHTIGELRRQIILAMKKRASALTPHFSTSYLSRTGVIGELIHRLYSQLATKRAPAPKASDHTSRCRVTKGKKVKMVSMFSRLVEAEEAEIS